MTWDQLMERMKALEATRVKLGRCSCGRRPCFCGVCHDCEEAAFRQLNVQAITGQAREMVELRRRIKEGRTA